MPLPKKTENGAPPSHETEIPVAESQRERYNKGKMGKNRG